MQSKLLITLAAAVMATGCAIKMADPQASTQAKQFKAPPPGKAGLYVYRNASLGGGAVKKDIWVDGKCLGGLMTRVFFYTELAANQKHRVDTEAEFSATNAVELTAKPGQLYFARQTLGVGVLTGRASLELVPEAEGRSEVGFLEMGVNGDCSVPTLPGAAPETPAPAATAPKAKKPQK